jgi:hypothetical protein
MVHYKFFPFGVLAAFGHKTHAKIMHESPKSVSKIFSVTAFEGTYQNTESIKHV